MFQINFDTLRVYTDIWDRFQDIFLTLSAMGGAGPSIVWGGQFDPHFLTAPWGLLDHNFSNFNHYTV